MKLTYIYHSGFAIEGDDSTIIIDYYKDSCEDPYNGIVHSELLKRRGKLYVLCTHSHADHYNSRVLEWKNLRNDIIYIFSKDIQNKIKTQEDIIYLDKLDKYNDNLLSIQAFGSTDLGISFLIKAEEKVIFHAGDLNNWHWNEESTKEEIREAEDFFERELNLLAGNVEYIDLAMFPIDIRLGKDYMKGAEQFVKSIKTKMFSPMHFGEGYDTIHKFETLASLYGCRSINWMHRGESFKF